MPGLRFPMTRCKTGLHVVDATTGVVVAQLTGVSVGDMDNMSRKGCVRISCQGYATEDGKSSLIAALGLGDPIPSDTERV